MEVLSWMLEGKLCVYWFAHTAQSLVSACVTRVWKPRTGHNMAPAAWWGPSAAAASAWSAAHAQHSAELKRTVKDSPRASRRECAYQVELRQSAW